MDISQDFDFSHLEDISEIKMPELKAIVAWLSAENFFSKPFEMPERILNGMIDEI